MATSKKLLIIRSNTYDFTNFEHPGGEEIIKRATEMSKVGYDCDVMIKMYHPTGMWNSIDRTIEELLVKDQDQILKPKGGEIDVKDYDYSRYKKFKQRIEKSNIPRLPDWKFWSYIMFQLCSLTILSTYIYSSETFTETSLFVLMFSAFESSLMFNIFHDSSHYALFKTPKYNEIVSNIVGAWITWDGVKWHSQHVHSHHSFTGDLNLDVDLIVYIYYVFDGWMTHINILLGPLIFLSFMFYQSLAYGLNRLTNCKYRAPLGYYIIYMIKVCFMLSLGYAFPVYWISASFWYWINIIGDHDQAEVLAQHYNGKDWLTRQVMNSGNFLESNIIWTYWFGGINQQIAHHVLPNYNNWSLRKIMRELRDELKDDEQINFVSAPSLWCLVKSFLTRHPNLKIGSKVYANPLNKK